MPIADLIADELTAHTVDLMRIDASIRRKILGNLKMLEKDLIKKIADIDPTSSDSAQRRLARLNKLLDQTERTIKAAYRGNRDMLHDELTDLAKLESRYGASSLNGMIGVDLVTVGVPPSTHRALAKGAIIQGSPSSEWWGRQAASLRQRFSDQVTQGVLSGESLNRLVQRIRGTATGNWVTYEFRGQSMRFREFAGGIMDISTRDAEALVRTSVQNVANEARMITYEENADVINRVQALVTLDNRTTKLCMGRSGLVWDLETKKPVGHSVKWPGHPPWHFNCRTTLVPLTKSWTQLQREAGRKKIRRVREIPTATQASMDGQVAGDLTYQDWLSKKSEKFQREVLGEQRFNAFKKGKIDLIDLVDQQSGRPLSVAELKEKVGAAAFKPPR